MQRRAAIVATLLALVAGACGSPEPIDGTSSTSMTLLPNSELRITQSSSAESSAPIEEAALNEKASLSEENSVLDSPTPPAPDTASAAVEPATVTAPPTTKTVTPTTSSPDVATPYSAPSRPEDLVPAKTGLPAEPQQNENGDAILLDETALLACAHIQFAWVGFLTDELDTARSEIVAGALRAEPSAVAEIAALVPSLQGAFETPDPLAVTEAALAVCTARGFTV